MLLGGARSRKSPSRLCPQQTSITWRSRSIQSVSRSSRSRLRPEIQQESPDDLGHASGIIGPRSLIYHPKYLCIHRQMATAAQRHRARPHLRRLRRGIRTRVQPMEHLLRRS